MKSTVNFNGKIMKNILNKVDLFYKKALGSLTKIERFAQVYDRKSLQDAAMDLRNKLLIDSAESGETVGNLDFSDNLQRALDVLYSPKSVDQLDAAVKTISRELNSDFADRSWVSKVQPELNELNNAIRSAKYEVEPNPSSADDQAEIYVSRVYRVLEENQNVINKLNYQGYVDNQQILLDRIDEALKPVYNLKNFISQKSFFTPKDNEALSTINRCIDYTIGQKHQLTMAGLRLAEQQKNETADSIYS